MRLHRRILLLPLAAALVLSSCSDQTTGPGDSAVRFTIYSGDGQSGTVGQELPQPIRVIATDANDQPIADQVVNFVVTQGSGSVYAGTAVTDATGLAAEYWTLGTTAGVAQSVEVRAVLADGTKQVYGTFTASAVADAPDTFVIQAGDSQSADAGTAVAIPPAVRLADRFGNAVSGAAVTFQITSGGGSVSGASATTDAQGIAAVGSWTLGANAGTNQLEATTSALPGSTLVFAATAIPTQGLEFVTNPEDTVENAVAFTLQPVIQLVEGNGIPVSVSGVAVTAQVVSGTASLGGTTTVLTDANGRAAFTDLKLTGLVGESVLGFSAPGYTGITSDTITITPGLPASVALLEGNGQNGAASTPVAIAPAVTVTDVSGNPVPGAAVTFAVVSGGGSVTGAAASTDAAGVARVGSWSLGASPGANSLSATVSGSGITGNPVTFTATVTSNYWVTTLSPMPAPRRFAGMAVLNGELYAAGGKDPQLRVRNTVLSYNPATDVWTPRTNLTTARVGPSFGVINGIWYIAGGNDVNGNSLTSVEAYDPATGVWTARAPMPVGRAFGASAVVNGKLYVAAGGVGNSQTASVVVYDPVANSWSYVDSVSAARNDAMAVSLNGLLYVIGGQTGNTVDGALQVYDPATHVWTQLPPMPTPRFHCNVEVLNGKIYVSGGLITGSINVSTNEVYNPATGTWATVADLPTARAAAATGVINGIWYIAGGSSNNNVQNANEAFVP